MKVTQIVSLTMNIEITSNNQKGIKTLFLLLLLFNSLVLKAQTLDWKSIDIQSVEALPLFEKLETSIANVSVRERIDFHKKGYQIALYQNNNQRAANFACQVASEYLSLDSLSESLFHINRAKELVDTTSLLAILITNIQGIVHGEGGDLEQSLFYFYEALALAKRHHPTEMITPLGSLSIFYSKQKDYKKALYYIGLVNEKNKALPPLERSYNLSYNYKELAVIHENMGQLDTAVYYGKLAVEEVNKIGLQTDLEIAVLAYTTLANLYSDKMNQPDLALPLLDSISVHTGGTFKYTIIESRAKYFLAKKDYKKVEQLFQQINLDKIKSIPTKRSVLELEARYYRTVGDYENAFRTSEMLRVLDEEWFEESKLRLAAFSDAKFNNQAKQEEIEELNSQQKIDKVRFRLYLFMLLGIGSLIIGGLLFSSRQRRRFTKALWERETKYRSIVETNQFGIVVCNRDGYFIEANQAFCDMLGYTKEELYTKKVKDVTASGGTIENIEKQKKLATGESKNISIQKQYIKKTGEIVEGRVNINGRYDENGKLLTYYATVADLTERFAFERKIEKLLEEVKQSNEDLERSNEDLSRFAYAASHDLQEPIRTIGSFVGLLEEENEGKLDEDSKEYMRYIVDGVVRMRALIDALLAYAKMGQSDIQLQSIQPKGVLDKVLMDLSVKIEETNSKVIIGELPDKMMIEPSQMGMVFFNLINNGIKFNKSDEPTVHVKCEERSDDFLFTVKDNGIGIDEKNYERIFEIFKRLHRKEDYQGTGIGLASVRKIIEKHNGKVWLESRVGEGTTFYFTIPK